MTLPNDPFAAPPSYDAATYNSAPYNPAYTRMPPCSPASGKSQYGDFDQEKQRQRERQSYSYEGERAGPSSGYAASAPTCASSANYASQTGMALDPKTALARFGSPYATSSDWNPSPHDGRLTQLPQLDLELRLKMRFSGPSSEQRAMAPPPSFSRQPRLAYSTPFEPVYIRSAHNKKVDKQILADGFQPVYPGRLMVQHDVSAADWGRFLEDLVIAGKLTGKQSIISNVAPMTMHMGATGYFVTRAIEKRIKKRKDPLIAEMAETWQQDFFTARGLDVYILYNGERITARSPNAPIPGITAPIPPQLQRSSTASSSSSSSSSSGSDSSEDERELASNGLPLDRRQRKELRKQRKAERKQRRAQRKHERKMAKIERKHNRDQKRNGNVSSLAGGSRGGYLLVIAPLSTTPSAPSAGAAAFMW